MRNKHANGRAIRGAQRLRHRGKTWWISRSRIYTEDGTFFGWIWRGGQFGDARRAIDEVISQRQGAAPRLHRRPRRRQFGRIISAVEEARLSR